MYFSFFSNCEAIKLSKAPSEKYYILSCDTIALKRRFNLNYKLNKLIYAGNMKFTIFCHLIIIFGSN